MPVKNLITFRKGTASEWASSSQPLTSGEPGFDITNNILKIGDGLSLWNNLKSVVDITKDTQINGKFTAATGNFTESLNINATRVVSTVDNTPYLFNCSDIILIDGDSKLQILNGNKVIFSTVPEEGAGSLDNTYIGGFYGCSIDKTIIGENIPSIGNFSVLNATQSIGVSGSVVVRNGDIRVYDDGPYSTTISATGLQINYTTSLTDVDLVDLTIQSTPTSFLNNTILDGRNIFKFFPRKPIVGDKVLFRNFSDPKNNGIYQLQPYYDNHNEIVPEWAIPIRVAPYANNTSVANLSRVKNKYDNIVYILNLSTNGGNSTVGVDNLIFSPDPGEQVMTIQSTKDVDFIASISAKQKYFRIQHPDPDSPYQYLQYGSLESPYNGVRLTGCGKLKKGECKIVLPSYMKYLIHENDINIQLTNKSHHKILYVDKIDLNNNSFIVKGYRSKTGGPYEFYWSFTGIRKDVPLLVAEQ